MTPSLIGLTDALASPIIDGRADRVVEAGQQLMDAWHAAGWVPHPIVLARATHLTEGAFAQVLPHTSGDVKRPHPMCIALDDTGHFPSFLKREVSPLRATAPAQAPYLAMVMGHEAGHTVFQKIWSPFQPGQHKRLFARQPDLIDAINDHVLGAAMTNPFDLWLEESFADVYGAMLVLRTSGFERSVLATVQHWAAVRQDNHEWFLSQGHSLAPVGAWSDPEAVFMYDTAGALTRLLERTGDWERATPERLVKVAQEVISDLWLERAAAHAHKDTLDRLWGTGHNRFANRLAVAVGEGNGEAFLDQSRPALSHHPVWRQWLAVMRRPEMKEAPRQEGGPCNEPATFETIKAWLNDAYMTPAVGEPSEADWVHFMKGVRNTRRAVETQVLPAVASGLGVTVTSRRTHPRHS